MEPEQINANLEVQTSKRPSTFLVYLVFVIIVLGMASWAGVYMNKNKVVDVQNVLEVNETDTWKTYRNDEYGFEFKYPAEWIPYEKENGVAFGVDIQNNHGVAGVTIEKNVATSDVKKWLISWNGQTEMSDVKIGDTTFLKWFEDDQIPNGGWSYSTIINKNGVNFALSISSNFEVEKILSTFKFTK